MALVRRARRPLDQPAARPARHDPRRALHARGSRGGTGREPPPGRGAAGPAPRPLRRRRLGGRARARRLRPGRRPLLRVDRAGARAEVGVRAGRARGRRRVLRLARERHGHEPVARGRVRARGRAGRARRPPRRVPRLRADHATVRRAGAAAAAGHAAARAPPLGGGRRGVRPRGAGRGHSRRVPPRAALHGAAGRPHRPPVVRAPGALPGGVSAGRTSGAPRWGPPGRAGHRRRGVRLLCDAPARHGGGADMHETTRGSRSEAGR